MLTEQDIKEVVFTKSLGGYKTSEVDAFLDQCAETVAALTTTNEENTRKLQVLAESVVEYRNQEDRHPHHPDECPADGGYSG